MEEKKELTIIERVDALIKEEISGAEVEMDLDIQKAHIEAAQALQKLKSDMEKNERDRAAKEAEYAHELILKDRELERDKTKYAYEISLKEMEQDHDWGKSARDVLEAKKKRKHDVWMSILDIGGKVGLAGLGVVGGILSSKVVAGLLENYQEWEENGHMLTSSGGREVAKLAVNSWFKKMLF